MARRHAWAHYDESGMRCEHKKIRRCWPDDKVDPQAPGFGRMLCISHIVCCNDGRTLATKGASDGLSGPSEADDEHGRRDRLHLTDPTPRKLA
jgi:hypothetical protein